MAGVRSDDVMYINLPLYHSAAFLMGLCGTIEKGNVYGKIYCMVYCTVKGIIKLQNVMSMSGIVF